MKVRWTGEWDRVPAGARNLIEKIFPPLTRTFMLIEIEGIAWDNVTKEKDYAVFAGARIMTR